MTLILSVACRNYVAQVSDRLLTDVMTRRPFDLTSNKNLVYITPGAQVAIGYSGIAYLDGIPTDQWIAQQLTGLTFAAPGEPPRSHLGLRERILDIGQSGEYLRRKLDAWADRNMSLRSLAPQVVIAGWQFTRRTWRPILWVLEFSKLYRQYAIARAPSDYWWFRGRFYLSQVPKFSELSRADFAALRVDLKRRHDEASAERVLTEVIQSVSTIGSTVGPHCMSILLAPPWENRVRVRYIPQERLLNLEGDQANDKSLAPLTSSLMDRSMPVYFSPWLIFPSRVVPPSRRVGMGAMFSYGELKVHFESPEFQIPSPPDNGIPTYHFGSVTPDLDDVRVSLSYSDLSEEKTEIGNSNTQFRPRDPSRRQNG